MPSRISFILLINVAKVTVLVTYYIQIVFWGSTSTLHFQLSPLSLNIIHLVISKQFCHALNIINIEQLPLFFVNSFSHHLIFFLLLLSKTWISTQKKKKKKDGYFIDNFVGIISPILLGSNSSNMVGILDAKKMDITSHMSIQANIG